jgi:integrase
MAFLSGLIAFVKKSASAGPPIPDARLYSLRHRFVSELANANVPADVRRQISGHNDEKIHERYTHLDVDTKRRALAHLRSVVKTEREKDR